METKVRDLGAFLTGLAPVLMLSSEKVVEGNQFAEVVDLANAISRLAAGHMNYVLYMAMVQLLGESVDIASGDNLKAHEEGRCGCHKTPTTSAN